MRIFITEQQLKTIETSLIKEGTNMREMYHRTPLDRLVNIIKTNALFMQESNHPARGSKYYLSLTRYKNGREGYNVLLSAEEDSPMDSYAVLTIDMQRLMSNVHGLDVRPFDFYANKDPMVDKNDKDSGISSKVTYQKLNRSYGFDYDDPEFYNMAEENIISDTVKELPHALNFISRIDVYFPNNEFYNGYEEDWDAMEGYERTYKYAYALYKVTYGTQWENKITIHLISDYISGKDQATMNMKQFRHWFRQLADYKYKRRMGKKVAERKPMSRKHIHPLGY